jgi:hypothetical protein
MAEDFLEQLANLEVQAPPQGFDRQLHQRVNRSLAAQQLLDLVLGGLPWALLQFAYALAGLVAFSITGRFGGKRKT